MLCSRSVFFAGLGLAAMLILTPTSARPADPAPFRIDSGRIVAVETPFPSSEYSLRQPLWSPGGAGVNNLALQAYLVTDFSGILVIPDVTRQMEAGKITIVNTMPKLDFSTAAARKARLSPGTWYTGEGEPSLLYSGNGRLVMGRMQYGASGNRAIFRGNSLLREFPSADLSYPAHAPGCPWIACEVGVLGTAGDIGAFTLADSVAKLIDTPALAETRPACCPRSNVVAYLEMLTSDASPALNVLTISKARDGKLSARRQYTDGGGESRGQLGVVDAFSWCPRVFVDPGKGEYGLLAYYRRRSVPDNPKDTRYDLWVVPVSLQGRILSGQAFKVCASVEVELQQVNPTPPAWHPDGEHIFFLDFRPGSNPLRVARIAPETLLTQNRPAPPVWEMDIWSPGGERPTNIAISCSGDGAFLALIAAGKSPQNPKVLQRHAYILPLLAQ